MEFMPHEKGAVEVHSRLKAWWMVNFNKYQLVQIREMPDHNAWVQLKEHRTWVLKKHE